MLDIRDRFSLITIFDEVFLVVATSRPAKHRVLMIPGIRGILGVTLFVGKAIDAALLRV